MAATAFRYFVPQWIDTKVLYPSKAFWFHAGLLVSFLFCSLPARAQYQSAFVFAPDPKGVAVYTRNDVSGVLTLVAGSPFPSKEPVNAMALDFTGRFLFTANGNVNPGKISMFTVDTNTGAVQEVPNSPFSSAATNAPVFLSTENSGQFVYVINANGSQAGSSSFETFNIDAANLALVPSSTAAVELPGLFVSGATHPSGKSFYAFLNSPFSTIPNQTSFLLFNSANGTFTTPDPNLGPNAGAFGCCFALDPQGKGLALGTGQTLTYYGLQSDGTLAPNPTTTSTSSTVYEVSFDPLGRFLYVDLLVPGSASLIDHFFSVPALQESPDSPLPSNFPSIATWSLDPTAPLIYADQVYQVSPQTGVPSSIVSSSPISPSAVFSRPPGSQPVVGPIAQLSPTSLSFGSLTVGQPSSALTLTITSIGGQALSVNTIAITGTNSADFSISTDTCHEPVALPPNNSCSVLITFTPSATGARSAALTITDNASPSTQSAPVSGTGPAPAPAVTLMPGSLSFGSVTLGTNSPMNVSVENSGTAPLHISSIVVGGVNASDYSSSSSTCNAAIAVNSGCTVTVTFTPQAAGVRSALLTITDDAPNSPQTVTLSGTGFSNGPGISLSPATPSFPTTTQGTSSAAQMLTVTNSGNAPLHVSSVSLGGSNASEFSLNSGCNAAVAPGANCTISMVFSPVVAGQRTASLMIADDVSGSPQSLALSGTANPAFTAGAAPGGSTTATVSAGQTAQYQLQFTPGPGYSGTVALSCSGAPTGAVCQAPKTVSISNGAAAMFTVSIQTSGPAQVLPLSEIRFQPLGVLRALSLLAIAMAVLLLLRNLRSSSAVFTTKHFLESGLLAASLLFVVFVFGGCGGSGNASVAPQPVTPPPVVTPSGTSTIVITLSATSSTGQPLQLQPLQLTLTVN